MIVQRTVHISSTRRSISTGLYNQTNGPNGRTYFWYPEDGDLLRTGGVGEAQYELWRGNH